MSIKLSTIKAIYIDVLSKLYRVSEAENLFYITLHWLEKKSKTDVIVGNETLLQETYMQVLARLKENEPIQYITEQAPFYGLDFFVDNRVLIPRPETEQLVHLIIEENKAFAGSMLDIGTGCGCIALTLKKHIKSATLGACDISSKALDVAKKNANQLAINVEFFQLDVLNEDIGNYDIVVSNPPYISNTEKQTMDANVIDYEPHLALFVKDDPLVFYKKITDKALNKGASCYFETSEFYRSAMDQWLESSGYSYDWKQDFQQKDRILKVWK